MKIRLAVLDDLPVIVKILNETTLHLYKMDIQQWDYPWDENIIENQLKSNLTYIMVLDDKAIGTFCLNSINRINDLFVEPGSIYLSQIAVLPQYQGKHHGSGIIDYACQFARKKNKALFLDCWEGNKKLRDFYHGNGFEHIGNFSENDYFISVFKYK